MVPLAPPSENTPLILHLRIPPMGSGPGPADPESDGASAVAACPTDSESARPGLCH